MSDENRIENPVSKDREQNLRSKPPYGLTKQRSCTDIGCLILFFIFIVGYCVIAIFAYTNGNPKLLIFPTDSSGNRCGINATFRGKQHDFQERPNLFFFDLSECFIYRLRNPLKSIKSLPDLSCPTKQICVESCPDENLYYTRTSEQNRLTWPCDYDVTWTQRRDEAVFKQLVEHKRCAAYVVASAPLLKRCLPGDGNSEDVLRFVREMVKAGIRGSEDDAINETTTTSGLHKALRSFFTDVVNIHGTMDRLISDFSATWIFLVLLLLIACVVSLIWIVLMRWIAAPMIWFSLLAFLGVFGFGTYYCLDKYLRDKSLEEKKLIISTDFEYMKTNRKTWLALSIISAILLFVVLMTLIFLRKRIKIAIELIKESSKAVGSILSSLVFPIIPFAFQMGLLVGWIATMLFLVTSTKPIFVVSNSSTAATEAAALNGLPNKTVAEGSVCDPDDFERVFKDTGAVCHYSHDGPDPKDPLYSHISSVSNAITWAKVYLFFGLLWFMNFIIALGEMTLAGAFASWYWTFDKTKDLPALPVIASFWRCIRFHIGTLAFGSIIIAITQFIRACLEYVDRKLKKHQENEVAKFIMKCLKCFFWCLEKFLKYINRNAYIMCAIYGKSFCLSCKESFWLLVRNSLRAMVLDKVVDFLLFIGKVTVVGGMGLLSFYYYSGKFDSIIPDSFNYDVNYIYVPVTIVVVSSYVVSSGFFSVYEMAVDTLFLCFLEDLERNDGSAEKPYFMSKNLMRILGKKQVSIQ